jgi:hypothetical protein
MIIPTCSKCGSTIPSEDVNVANDVAYCRACNVSHFSSIGPFGFVCILLGVDAGSD